MKFTKIKKNQWIRKSEINEVNLYLDQGDWLVSIKVGHTGYAKYFKYKIVALIYIKWLGLS